MTSQQLTFWFSVVSVIGMLWGIVFAFFGLGILPVSRDVLVPWGNGVYGATLIGLSATLFFAGRHALRKNDRELMEQLLCGIAVWLVIEAAFSLYYRVWFNVAVDIGIMVLFGFLLTRGMRLTRSQVREQ
jgi:hypothetical protein